MNVTFYRKAKKELSEELGSTYPTCREELTFKFLTEFGAYVPGAQEDDYEDYEEYENAKYSSEQWAYYCILSNVTVASLQSGEIGPALWTSYIDWVVDNYFPEFTVEADMLTNDTSAKSLSVVVEEACRSEKSMSALLKDLQSWIFIVSKMHSIEDVEVA